MADFRGSRVLHCSNDVAVDALILLRGFVRGAAMKSLIRIAALCAVLGGCATSHVLVGTERPEIDPELVRIYIDPPPQFEKVAILETSSEGSFALTNQQKTNKVIERLKEEAASLGANGVLIQAIGSAQRGSVVNSFGTANLYGSGGSYSAYGTGFAIAAPVMVKEGTALAIYVPETATYNQTVQASPAPAQQPAPPTPTQQPPPPTPIQQPILPAPAQLPPAPPAASPAQAPAATPCNACTNLLNSYGG